MTWYKWYKESKLPKCPICAKEFVPAPEHAWKIGTDKQNRLVCSYTCMRKWERENYGEKRRKYG